MVSRVHLLVTTVLLIWLVALKATPLTQSRPRDLPPGEGRDEIMTHCSDCHGIEKVTSPRRSRAEWQDLVQDMAARNGVATDDDIKVIVRYVVANFGRVNVNRATAADLLDIVQLAADEAAAIVDFRNQAGEYRALEDLRKVPGIDFAKIQERKDRIVFTGP